MSDYRLLTVFSCILACCAYLQVSYLSQAAYDFICVANHSKFSSVDMFSLQSFTKAINGNKFILISNKSFLLIDYYSILISDLCIITVSIIQWSTRSNNYTGYGG